MCLLHLNVTHTECQQKKRKIIIASADVKRALSQCTFKHIIICNLLRAKKRKKISDDDAVTASLWDNRQQSLFGVQNGARLFDVTIQCLQTYYEGTHTRWKKAMWVQHEFCYHSHIPTPKTSQTRNNDFRNVRNLNIE